MAKELYLYSGIYDFTAEEVISSLEENKSEDIMMRMNCPGGSVFAGWGIIAKMREHEGKIKIKVDGYAASMASMVLLYADSVEALDVSRIMIHRADMWVRNPEDQAFLNSVNKDLKKKLAAKINVEKLKELKGVSLEDIFNPETRIDVWLSAKEAQQVGLINKISNVNPKEVKALTSAWHKIAAELQDPENQEIKKPVNKIMTLAELKAQHPAVYAEAMAEGVTAERDRVEAWMAFVDVDAESVTKGIAEGKPITSKAMAEFTRKAMNAEAIKKITGDNVPPVSTTEVTAEKTDKAKKVESFEAEAKSILNLK